LLHAPQKPCELEYFTTRRKPAPNRCYRVIHERLDTPLTADELANAIQSDYADPTNDGPNPDTVAIFQQVDAPPGTDVVVGSVPEPATLTLIGAALFALGGARSRRRVARVA